MANSYTHAGLPFPVYNARFTLLIPYLDADGDPTDPTTPDTEISKDAGSFADCTEEVSTITGSNGTGYITLTGAEMKCVIAAVCAKVASGPKATLAFLQPRVLPVISNGTAQSGANTNIRLASTAPAYDLTGCIVRTTGGTGGGGTDGLNNQARVITAYDVATKDATVFPAWETNPSSDTTYDILLTDMAANSPVTRALRPATDGRTLAVDSNGRGDISLIEGSDATDQINAACDTAISDAGVTATRMGALTDWLDGGRLDLLLDALLTRLTETRAGYLDNLSGGSVALASGVTVTTNNDKSGYSLTVTPPTASAIADAVLDEALSGHSTPGTAGISLTDILGYVTALRSALTDLRAAALDRVVGTIAAGTHNPQSGDAYGRIGVNGAGLSALGDTRISFLDASILSRSSHSAADVWAVTTRTLSSFGSLISDIATAVWGAVARTITGGTVDTCTTNTDMRGTDNALLASNYISPPSTSSIADAVWDEATSGHVSAGTTGLALTSASAPTAEQVADAVWDESVSGHTTGGSTGAAIIAAGSAGDPWSTLIPGAYGAGTAGKIVGDNINATILSRSSHSAADVWAVSTRTLSSFGSLVTDIATAVWGAATRTLSAFGFTVAPTVSDIRTEIDSNSTQLTAIRAKTDQLIFTVAGHVDATASITGGGDATEAHQLDMIDKLTGLMSKAHVLTTAVGTFAPATDSNEAIRDRGDVAWNNGSINTMASTRPVTFADSSDAIIQDCAYKDISFKSGDDFEFDLDFPMDITAYTITAVVDGVSFTVTKKTAVRVGFSLTATQTATLRDNFPWSLTLVNAGKTRKYITGKYIKI